MKLLLKYLFLIFVIFVFNEAKGQTSDPRQEYYNSEIMERKFDEEKWKELVKDFDYSEQIFEDYDEEIDSLEINPNSTNNTSQTDNSGGLNGAFWACFFQILFIIAVGAVIIFLLVSMLGAGDIFGPRNRKISTSRKSFSIEKIENKIHETDLERYIREAVENKEYALAIRLYYLAIIKELSLSKLIKWKRDKTNRNYLNEIRTTGLFKAFRETTRIFERIWYGEGSLDEPEYLSIKPKFEQLIKDARANAPASEID